MKFIIEVGLKAPRKPPRPGTLVTDGVRVFVVVTDNPYYKTTVICDREALFFAACLEEGRIYPFTQQELEDGKVRSVVPKEQPIELVEA